MHNSDITEADSYGPRVEVVPGKPPNVFEYVDAESSDMEQSVAVVGRLALHEGGVSKLTIEQSQPI